MSTAASSRVGELIDLARSQTGLDDFGGDTWRAGLEVLVGSAQAEARFTEFGEQMFYGGLVRTLCNRLQIERWFADHPEIEDEEVVVESLGVGFPRTGSTALAAMLGEDTSMRSLLVWEAAEPCPPPGISAEADAARLAIAEATIAAQGEALPKFRSMLPQSANGPIEDHDLMGLEFTSQVHLSFARVPTYAEWFKQCDMEPSYRYERRVLKLLQWKSPVKRWQLKSPTHTLFLRDFAKVFPETKFVMTHRDVAAAIPSVADLYCTLLSFGNTGIDPVEVGMLNVDQWGTALDRVLAFRADGNEDKFYDIGFRAFQADPIGEIAGLYRWLGRPLTDETRARMQAWRDANPRDKHGTHTYDAVDFGLSDELMASRFGAYHERFASYL